MFIYTLVTKACHDGQTEHTIDGLDEMPTMEVLVPLLHPYSVATALRRFGGRFITLFSGKLRTSVRVFLSSLQSIALSRGVIVLHP
jgi:hypothetical protein